MAITHQYTDHDGIEHVEITLESGHHTFITIHKDGRVKAHSTMLLDVVQPADNVVIITRQEAGN